jgi:hypothetical protein
VGADIAYAGKLQTFLLSFSDSVGTKEFKNQNFMFDYGISLNSSTTMTNFIIEQGLIFNPENYYYDNFSAKYLPRPRKITKVKSSIHIQQIWGDFYKTKTEFSYLQASEDRPASYGLIFKQVYTEDYLNSIRLDAGIIFEDRTQQLKSERGYFSTYWVEAAYNLGLNYNISVSPSYGYLIEEEKNSKTEGIIDRNLRSASDVYGLQFQYLGNAWHSSLKAEFLEANTGYRSQQIQGSIQWDI